MQIVHGALSGGMNQFTLNSMKHISSPTTIISEYITRSLIKPPHVQLSILYPPGPHGIDMESLIAFSRFLF